MIAWQFIAGDLRKKDLVSQRRYDQINLGTVITLDYEEPPMSESDRPYGTGSSGALSQAINCQATIS